MNAELRNYVGRAKRYENIDGTGEMFLGLMLLGFALAGCLEAKLPENSSRWMHGVVIYGVMIPVLAFGYWIRGVIKKRITWPRTGYAAFPRGGKSWWIAMVIASLIAVVVASGFALLAGIARRHHAMSLPIISVSILYILLYAFWVFRMGKEHWWKWLVLFFMALGLLAIALIASGDFHRFGQSVSLFLGLVWFGSGTGTLYSYIRHTKPATTETE